MSDLYRVIYASRVSADALNNLEAEVEDILRVAIRENKKRSITGLLIAHQGWFVQALEGPKNVVIARLNVIVADPRHRNAIILMEGATEARMFEAWSMCCKTLSATDAAVIDVLDKRVSFDPTTIPERSVVRLLTTIAEVHRRSLTKQYEELGSSPDLD